MKTSAKLLVFDSHPIQYRAPVFRELHRLSSQMKVYFFNSSFDGSKWWFHEVGKAKSLAWGIDLTEGYPNETLNTEPMGFWKIYQKLKSILLEEKPQAILLYGYYLKEHWMLHFLCRKLKIALIFVGETYTSHSSPLRKIFTQPLQSFFFKGVQKFISIGSKTEGFYLSKNISPSQIISAKYCVDTHFFRREEPFASQRRVELRKSLNIESTDFVLLFVGRLFERKRPQDIIALHELLLPHKNIHTVVIGSGPLQASLQSSCQELPRLHWLGFQNQNETRDWYFASDLLVVPSEFETWGLVVNEAFSCGLPALVSNTCGVADDLVQHGENGFIYPVGTIQAAHDHVKLVLENREFLQKLGHNAQQKVLENYRPDQFAQSIYYALTQIVDVV